MPVAGTRRCTTKSFQDGGHHIHAFGEGFFNGTRARGPPCILDHQRDAEAFIKITDLAEQPMIAQLLTMI